MAAMKKIHSTDEIRDAFLEFFKHKGHTVVPSDLLVPKNDPTLLFTSAGMNQFKEQFLGHIKGYRRAVTSQKCLRTDDLDKVGKTAVHHTFFEMLGNFSFGDYFKKEAIEWAWEFMTKVLGIAPERLWVSVYEKDDETYNIWKDVIKLPEKKIVRLGAKKNFWPSNAPEEGPNGPCGPCSEIFFDSGEDAGCKKPDCSVDCDCGRFAEVWNLVFTQFDRKGVNNLAPLPNKNIDTGMGLERIASVMQGVPTNFQIDILKPLVDETAKDIGVKYGKDKQTDSFIHAIADHVRAVSFAIVDGVLPSNEERGYVVRKIIRKAAWHGKSLGKKEPFLYKLVPIVAKVMKKTYPEVEARRENISQIILAEEKRFHETLSQGQELLMQEIENLKKKNVSRLDGEFLFKLYDTYGFPLDLTKEIAGPLGLSLDIDGFNKNMKKQKETARASSTLSANVFEIGDAVLFSNKTEFAGYKENDIKAKVIGVLKDGKSVDSIKAGEKGELILDKTPFYAESGGQVGDTGEIKTGASIAFVENTIWAGDTIAHVVNVEKGDFKKGQEVEAKIDAHRRRAVQRNHTATHLLQAALRIVLGKHVQQAGSLVNPQRLRFDFTHFSAVKPEELARAEELVNSWILNADNVSSKQMDIEEAKAEGAIALFGEKYEKKVRVISVGSVSKELCGGCHVGSIGEIGLFKIVSEGAISSGVRRIEALTGEEAYKRVKEIDETISGLSSMLKVPAENLSEQIEKLALKVKDLEKHLERFRLNEAKNNIDAYISKALEVKDVKIISQKLESATAQLMRSIIDLLRDKVKSGIFIFGTDADEKALFIVGVTQDLVKKGVNAGKIVGEVAKIAGGTGGGRPELAQAGAKDAQKLNEALLKAVEIAKEQIQ